MLNSSRTCREFSRQCLQLRSCHSKCYGKFTTFRLLKLISLILKWQHLFRVYYVYWKVVSPFIYVNLSRIKFKHLNLSERSFPRAE